MTESNQTIINADLNDESFENRVCPECGASLIVRSTKNGHILGCSNYPVCNYLENINLHGVKILKVLDGKICPLCGDSLAVKKSKYGLFIGCQNYPDCKYIYTEQEQNEVTCPSCCSGVLKQHANKYGKSFYSCSNYRNCQYKVSYKPVTKKCSKCGFPIMLVRVNKFGKYYQCAAPGCKTKCPITSEQE
jgi:putative DNA topoisomerase